MTLSEKTQTLLRWTALGALVGIAAGVASAVFLLLLEVVTKFREAHEAIVYSLPVAGLAVGWFYERWGQSIRAGNNLVIDTIHDNQEQIPLRMAPMVLMGTVLTHLFGGSAGREGTAVQMGASLADALSHRLRLGPHMRKLLLAAGIAGGFGSVFGTPMAGTLFGLEVVCIGRMDYEALAPALVAALVGDYVTRHLGVVHTAYPQLDATVLTPAVLAKLVVVACAMALASSIFVEFTHRLKGQLERGVPRLPWRMFTGGALVVLMWKLMGTSDYLGLGVPMIVRAFVDPRLPVYAFLAKLTFTSVTLASGFLGGEVTPLFFVGATLGNVMARALQLPIALGAAVGMAAVFGSAANTPLALSVMAVELLGAAALPHVAVVCVLAYLLSGHRGIYPAQRMLRRKHGGALLPSPLALRDFRETPPRGRSSAGAARGEGETPNEVAKSPADTE